MIAVPVSDLADEEENEPERKYGKFGRTHEVRGTGPAGSGFAAPGGAADGGINLSASLIFRKGAGRLEGRRALPRAY